MATKYGPCSEQHNLRPRRLRDYGHIHTTLESIVMTQHSVKKGLQIYGHAGVEAVLSELQQLHDREVMEPKSIRSDMTGQQQSGVLYYLMSQKQKCCGKIKGYGCTDGRKQRECISKDETSSPTPVAIKSVMLSCTSTQKRDTMLPLQTYLEPSCRLTWRA